MIELALLLALVFVLLLLAYYVKEAMRPTCLHPWPDNYPEPRSWYCRCGTKVYRSYEDYAND